MPKTEMHIYADPAIIKAVKALADKERRSLTQQCLLLIEEALEHRRQWEMRAIPRREIEIPADILRSSRNAT